MDAGRCDRIPGRMHHEARQPRPYFQVKQLCSIDIGKGHAKDPPFTGGRPVKTSNTMFKGNLLRNHLQANEEEKEVRLFSWREAQKVSASDNP